MDQELIDHIRKYMPQKIAEDLCSVQPMNIAIGALAEDPLVNTMLTNFVNRLRNPVKEDK